MNIKKIRDNIQERIEKSAWTTAGMKQYEKVRVELIIWAFLFCVSSLGLIAEILFNIIGNEFTFRFFSYLLMIGLSCLAFLGKSFQFRHFYMLKKLHGNINKNAEIEISTIPERQVKLNKKTLLGILLGIILLITISVWWLS